MLAPDRSRLLLPTRSLLAASALLAAGAVVTSLVAWGRAGEAYERALYLRTLWLAVETIVLAVPLGLLLAWLLLRVRPLGSRLLLLLVAAQLFMPLYLHASAWEAGFGRMGWYSVSAAELDDPLLSGWAGALWTHAVGALSWVVVLVAAGIWTSDVEAEQAALLETRPSRTAVHILLPQLVPWLAVASLWIAVQVATEMTAADLYLVDTYARELYTGFALGRSGGEVFLSTLPALLLTAQLAAAGMLLAAAAAPAGLASFDARPLRYHGSATARGLAAGAALSLLVLLAVPLANLLYQVGRTSPTARWSAGTLLRTLASGVREFQDELYWSAVIGAVTAVVVVPLALLLGAALAARRWVAATIVLGLTLLAALPGPLIGIGLVAVLDHLPPGAVADLANRSVLAPVLAAALRALPWTTLLMWCAWRSLPRESFEAARLDGAGRVARLLRIALPQLLPAALLAGLVVFGLASGELAATLLVASPGMPTVAIRLFGLIHSGAREKEAALALLNVGSSLLLGLLALAAGRLLLRRART